MIGWHSANFQVDVSQNFKRFWFLLCKPWTIRTECGDRDRALLLHLTHSYLNLLRGTQYWVPLCHCLEIWDKSLNAFQAVFF